MIGFSVFFVNECCLQSIFLGRRCRIKVERKSKFFFFKRAEGNLFFSLEYIALYAEFDVSESFSVSVFYEECKVIFFSRIYFRRNTKFAVEGWKIGFCLLVLGNADKE